MPIPTSESAGDTTSATLEPQPQTAQGGKPSLLRNTVYLTAAQVATVPLAVINNALMGRFLSAEEFANLYLATTLCSFAVLGLEWGQQGALPALVARDRARTSAYLGTSLTWRLMTSVAISGVLAAVCAVLGYNEGQKWALALAFPITILLSCGGAFKDTIRGFERTDIPALTHVAQHVLCLIAVVPVLLLGGRLHAVLIVNLVVVGLLLLPLRKAVSSLGVRNLGFDRGALKSLFAIGTPFVFFDFAMVLLPNVNATFLSKLTPPEVMAWFSVSQRLIGLLLFPATALVGALYPTLCRLHSEDRTEFARLSNSAIYGTTLLAVPAAVGCALFPEVGVSIFGLPKFAGAIDHLHVMSAFVFLVYFSMPLGICILAANRQRAWALVQGLCVVVSLVGNPFLVPYFQELKGNGAIGTCITLVFSEAMVVACGIALAPRGVFNLELSKSILLAIVSGAAMASVAWLLKPISLFLAIPAALLAYAAVARLTGALNPTTVAMMRGALARKLGRTG
jgi:O-antigen/teichoic acid export membrane protein